MKYDIETEALLIYFMPAGYIFTTVKKDVDLKLVHLQEFVKAVSSLAAEKSVSLPLPVLVDLTAAKSMNKEARDFASTEDKVHKCVGLITKSAISKIIGNFFIGLTRAKFPLKLFTDSHAAQEWVKQYVSHN